jgi:hypothetical protein
LRCSACGELPGTMEAARGIHEASESHCPKQRRTSQGKVHKSGTEPDALEE